MTRKGSWMQTAGGRAYWPTDPRPEDVFIEDIAHALAHICRYGGHSPRFYSVAEHSVHVSYLVPPEDALHGLMHDSAEAYCGDIVRPLKGDLAGYADIEDANWRAICARFQLDPAMPQSVHDADVAMLFAERAALLGPSPLPGWGMGLETPITADPGTIGAWNPWLARAAFANRFRALTA